MDSFEFLKCFATSFKGFAWTVFFCDFKQKSSKPIQPPYRCRKNPKQLTQIWTLGGNALGFTESYLFPLDICVEKYLSWDQTCQNTAARAVLIVATALMPETCVGAFAGNTQTLLDKLVFVLKCSWALGRLEWSAGPGSLGLMGISDASQHPSSSVRTARLASVLSPQGCACVSSRTHLFVSDDTFVSLIYIICSGI